MNTATPAIQDLARRLIAFEAARNEPGTTGCETVRTCDKLRVPLAKLAGVAGFRTLMARTLALATVNAAWLKQVQVGPDGSLQGFEAACRQCDAKQAADRGVEVVAELLGLLVTFIGGRLTMRLVSDAWPSVSIGETEGQS